ncbi:uncharacterized protein P174DRAFT_150423 [Aspergillus novofumigatus IBT 16806]|uniref:Uncharacterized protein n=1 Tax=Aspergillus novofumigatus (strain IBT 16806) TaxID=1392255 RepID=A0A2I1CEF8_ASPN1|nr:uncharacterized protein P174DRAFT_150423 [Aspergillus novofumigatus IBT 16806]PKX96009.1 hypothetical protein P174DRAFT_150423 [Aspergillus novofumigatus IBT 16806]
MSSNQNPGNFANRPTRRSRTLLAREASPATKVVSPAWTPRSRETSLPRVARPPAAASSPVRSVPVRLVARVAAPPVVPISPRIKSVDMSDDLE